MNGIMKYISRIYRTTGVVYNNRLRDDGLNQCQHPYILHICREPGISQEKLAREICVNRSNVTRQLATMEKEGLIVRKQDKQDRRIWRVYPTERMEQLLPRARQERVSAGAAHAGGARDSGTCDGENHCPSQ